MILNCEKYIPGASRQLDDFTVYYITPGTHDAFAIFVLNTYRRTDMSTVTRAYYLRGKRDVDFCEELYLRNRYNYGIWNIVGNNCILDADAFYYIQDTTYKIKKIRSVRDIERILDEIN